MARKILFIQHAGGLGGSAYSLLYTLQGLRESGDECVVLLARPTAALATLYREAGFEVIADEPFALIDHSTVALRPLWWPGTYTEMVRAALGSRSTQRRLSTLIRRTNCDLVHLNSMPLAPLAYELNSMRVPYAWHVREPPPDQRLRTILIRSVMRNCHGMIFLSNFDRSEWMGDDQGDVISNFVPDRFFSNNLDREALRHSLGVTPDRVLALFLGGSHPAKGGDVLLRAIGSDVLRSIDVGWMIPNAAPAAPHRLVSRLGRRVLAMIGTGPRSVRFHNMLLRLSQRHTILYGGFCQDILPYFVAADLVLFPATLPHFARPVIEAAAVGRAVVASNLGGVNELVQHGATGLLIPPARPDSLAQAIRSLATDPSVRDTMGCNGSKVARERFQLTAQIRKIRAVHCRLCSSKATHAS